MAATESTAEKSTLGGEEGPEFSDVSIRAQETEETSVLTSDHDLARAGEAALKFIKGWRDLFDAYFDSGPDGLISRDFSPLRIDERPRRYDRRNSDDLSVVDVGSFPIYPAVSRGARHRPKRGRYTADGLVYYPSDESQDGEFTPGMADQPEGQSLSDSVGPRFHAELYRYHRETGDRFWFAKYQTQLDGGAPQIVQKPGDDGPPPSSITFEVTTMYAMPPGSKDLSSKEKRNKIFKAHMNLGSFMVINSPLVINMLLSVAPYDPMIPKQQSRLSFPEPYWPLIHYYDELRGLCGKKQAAITDVGTSTEDKKKAEQDIQHLKPLLDYISETHQSMIEQEKARWAKEQPMCTFEWLWMLFKPGTVVISWMDDIPRACIVHSHSRMRILDHRMEPPEAGHGETLRIKQPDKTLEIKIWSIDFDGDKLGRSAEFEHIVPFDGEKAIGRLPLVPIQYSQAGKHSVAPEDLKNRLIQRGKQFTKLTERTFCEYSGRSVAWPNRSINGRVMVDTELRYSDEGAFGDHGMMRPSLGLDEEQDWGNDNVHIDYGDMPPPRRSRRRDRDDLRRLKSSHPDDFIDMDNMEAITDTQFMLCAPTVWGFVTKLRGWELLNVEEIQPLRVQPDMINDLVLDENAKNMIKALANTYTTQRDSKGDPKSQTPTRWSADFVQNKGDGQIFLLHGKPGVGKTTTAECVAELTGRPLLSLTCGDLGITPVEVEKQLMKWLRLGTIWEAILLLDEADVYLESRRSQDLTRNSLVSIFLRALEYYQGILFLTSNRVGAFDDAFVSRIHVIIYYPPFSAVEREKIWNIFFRKLERERPNIRIHSSVYDFVSSDEVLKNLNWNGREIRNAFNTAVSLAEYENERVVISHVEMVNLHRRHLDQVVKMSKAFQVYLEKTHGMDEAKRAKVDRIRHDDASLASLESAAGGGGMYDRRH